VLPRQAHGGEFANFIVLPLILEFIPHPPQLFASHYSNMFIVSSFLLLLSTRVSSQLYQVVLKTKYDNNFLL